jgi:hypothetical protein
MAEEDELLSHSKRFPKRSSCNQARSALCERALPGLRRCSPWGSLKLALRRLSHGKPSPGFVENPLSGRKIRHHDNHNESRLGWQPDGLDCGAIVSHRQERKAALALQQQEGVSYSEAVRRVRQRRGVDLRGTPEGRRQLWSELLRRVTPKVDDFATQQWLWNQAAAADSLLFFPTGGCSHFAGLGGSAGAHKLFVGGTRDDDDYNMASIQAVLRVGDVADADAALLLQLEGDTGGPLRQYVPGASPEADPIHHFVRGSILLVSRSSVWNGIQGSTDGRHHWYSAEMLDEHLRALHMLREREAERNSDPHVSSLVGARLDRRQEGLTRQRGPLERERPRIAREAALRIHDDLMQLVRGFSAR